MNIQSLDNLTDFKRDLEVLEEKQFLLLVETNQDIIKVSTKTALKNLPKIFDEAIKIGNTKGFNATSLRDLSQATDMSLGKIYTYISAKDDLLLMLHSHYIKVIEDTFNQIGLPHKNPMDNLLLAVKAHLYLSQVFRPWFYFAFTESKHLNKKIIALAKESELKSDLYFRNIIQSGIQAKRFAAVDRNFTSSMIKALLQDWYLKPWKYAERNIDVDSYFKEIANLLTIYLTPKD
ncbi:TetR/AcrR family transcriptional regulator [Kangiella sp. HZ709]|uniref:TetR/AcrR family transcriptional regulator n=1 Tax=Kangiella sp. HZ709 TaxID=2666328 RepID=UPI0012B0076B|nr:TetR/AcrR family transcriptional regulator [Kangiella sp. HZ709]